MRPTLLQYVAVWSPILPFLAALLARRRMTRGRWWVAAWSFVLVLEGTLEWALGMRNINNHWVGYVFAPVSGGVALWAISHWQPDRTSRSALRFAVPLFVIVSVLLIYAFDDRSTFSLVSSPFHYLVQLFAALWTFVRLSMLPEEPIARQDWFWIMGGMILIAGVSTALGPLAWYLLRPRVDLLHAMLNVRAGAYLAAFVAITWGMLCQTRRTFSGGSFSPLSSPSSSSSAGSASPW